MHFIFADCQLIPGLFSLLGILIANPIDKDRVRSKE
jgi:hypothetical protein